MKIEVCGQAHQDVKFLICDYERGTSLPLPL